LVWLGATFSTTGVVNGFQGCSASVSSYHSSQSALPAASTGSPFAGVAEASASTVIVCAMLLRGTSIVSVWL
jgi:hypothetical protein